MTTKDKILELFELNKGVYFSGEEIARRISVSRAAVWKAVNTLRKEGYTIDAVTNKGYCLSEKTDILSPQGIRKYLHPAYGDINLHVFQTIDSTNTFLREKANQGFAEGYIAIAGEQTKGRGRYGRNFFSPSETGIYMSLLLRPSDYSTSQAARLTTMAAVAMCEAIEEVSNEEAKIKWVNDIYVKGKKVCGILTEASFGLENGLLDYAVLGIGVNVYSPKMGFPEELEPIAGAILDFPKDDAKNHLTAAFINHFMDYYTSDDHTGYIVKYRSRNMVIGKHITVLTKDSEKSAYAYGIDDKCRLLVRYEDGKEDCLSYGEINILL